MGFPRLVFLFLVAATVVVVFNALALRPWRRSVGAHWTERARLLWPARVGAIWNIPFASLLVTGLGECLWAEAAPHWSARLIAGACGGMAGSYFFDRAVFPALTFSEWLRQLLAGWGLRILQAAVLITAMSLMPPELNLKAFTIAALALVAMLALKLKLGVLAFRLLGILTPADARLTALVDATASQLGVRVKGVQLLGGPQALAYALPVTGELWFSRRLLAICSSDEVRAIAAHEIAHLAESRLTVVGRVAASVNWWPLVFMEPAHAKFGVASFFGLMLFCAGLGWLSRRMSHRLERRADSVAAGAQAHEEVYAGALEKLYRENQIPAVNPKGQRTHPSLYDRLTAAGKVPEYPRPQPPARLPWTTKLLFALFVGVLLYPAFREAAKERERREVLDWVDQAATR